MRHHFTRLVWLAMALALAVGRPSAASDSTVADAAERRAVEALKSLVMEGADVDAPQPDGATALHWVAHWDDVATASELLSAGADPNAANDYGVTPLLLAAENGSAEMVAALLHAGANPKAALPNGQTVLMTAVRAGSVEAVETLLSAGAVVNSTQASKQQTALMWAIAQRHADVARVLVESGADVEARTTSGFTPLLFAAREGDIGTARLLLEKGVDVNESSSDGATPLLTATARGHVDFALFLLEHGALPEGNVAEAGYTPLHWAVTSFETAPMTYPGIELPGEWAAMGGIPDRSAKLTLITALIERGADVNARTTKRLLHQAAPGATRLSSPGSGVTPFLAAAASADAEVMRLLVAHGADPLAASTNNETAMMLAAASDKDVSILLDETRRLEVVRLALELGVDLEAAETGRGRRALHLAARNGLHDIIAFLVEHGADLNAKTNPIWMPGYGDSERFIEPQTPLGLVEGTLDGGLHFRRPATVEFLLTLGAKSEGAFDPQSDPNSDKNRESATTAAGGITAPTARPE